MKYLFRALVFVGISLSFIACGPALNATSSPIIPSTATLTEMPTFTPLANPTATAIIVPTETRAYIPPTLIPTIDLAMVPGLLSDAFSVQKMEGINGHRIRKITGWDLGFGGGFGWHSCPGYVMLDETHFLVYPAAGEVNGPEGSWTGVDTVAQPVVLDLESGSTWQPPVMPPENSGICNDVHWSEKLGLLITTRLENDIPIVTTYKSDGHKGADYQGNLLDISPSRTKILIDGDTLVDLQTNSRIDLAWPSYGEEDPLFHSGLYWTDDETRVYKCCSFYADISTGNSFRFKTTDDMQITNVQTLEDVYSYSIRLPFLNGEWVRDNTFFLVHWSIVDDGDIRYLPMFDPVNRVIYDVREKAGISPDLTCPETTVSNSGSFVWLECDNKNYLIDLYTFEAKEYPGLLNMDVSWSADDGYVWFQGNDAQEETRQYYLVSIASKEEKQLPIKAASFSWADLWWNPVKNVLAYISEDGRKLGIVDAKTASVQETGLPTTFKGLYWSQSGDRMALVAEDGSVWQIDYPALENMEQLTAPVSSVKDISWSPDGSSISFVGGPDIYIVDAAK